MTAHGATARPHAGTFSHHDDDCWCVLSGAYCNRGGSTWSCCGACKEESECTAPRMHPTYVLHPRHAACVAGHSRGVPVYLSDEDIRLLVPEAFQP